jgi:hypothetical protein
MIRLFTVLVLSAGLAAAAPAAATSGTAGTLELAQAALKGQAGRSFATCPQGAPSGAICWAIDDKGTVRGLGTVDYTGVLVVESPHTSCEMWMASPVLSVKGKGTIQLSLHSTSCLDDGSGNGLQQATLAFSVTGGTGSYAGASGNGTDAIVGVGDGLSNGDSLTGTLVAPDASFDLTPPVIDGATSKVVHAPRGTKRVRVRFAVHAHDAVDGAVAVKCTRASGSWFRIGRTQVSCTATDSSANTARARFTVTVRPQRTH